MLIFAFFNTFQAICFNRKMTVPKCPWTVLAITCRNKRYACAIQEQLELKQELGLLPKNLAILCIEDPQAEIGSGGATLNALLVTTEHLSAKHGYTVVTSDVLKSARILIMHFGRQFPYDPCGRSFVCLPLISNKDDAFGLKTNFDTLFDVITTHLAFNSPPGLWVCSSDMLFALSYPSPIDWENLGVENGVVCFSVPTSVDYGTKHGVLKLDEDDTVLDLLYRETADVVSQCDTGNATVPLVAGIVFFSTFATEKLLETHVTPPLDACTYLGIDSGCDPLGLSLFFDILLPMTVDIDEDDFVCGQRSGKFGQKATQDVDAQKYMRNARSVLWKHLKSINLKAVVLESGSHCYLDIADSPQQYCATLRKNACLLNGYQQITHSHVSDQSKIGDDVVLINTVIDGDAIIGKGCTFVHCYISGNIEVGDNCYIYGIDQSTSLRLSDIKIPSGTTVIGMSVKFCDRDQSRLYAAMTENDKLIGTPLNSCHSSATDDTKLLREKMIASAVTSHPLPVGYSNVVVQSQKMEHNETFFMAKLFPVFHPQFPVDIHNTLVVLKDQVTPKDFKLWLDCWRCSLCELIENVDYITEFQHQQSLFLAVCLKKMKDMLLQSRDVSLLPFIKAFVATKQHNTILGFFDQVAIEAVEDRIGCKRRPDISARCFACIADVLGIMAGSKAGLRSGPSANKIWRKPLSLLENGNIKLGVAELAEVRESWLQHPDLLMRASRHYEGAEQILIRHAVKSATSFVQTVHCAPLRFNAWFTAHCPARIDLAGGWTDTPPVCYEYGGSVVNVAVLLNGKRPIGARVRRLREPVLILTMLGDNKSDTQKIECTAADQLMDYYQPQAPAALLKACFVLSGIVNPCLDEDLAEQLLVCHGGGFELQTWSHLPRGSGLGTSSILAGAIMTVLYRAARCAVDVDSLLHSVLVVEQMLTTGGGWQDQVGGMVGGIKIGRSSSSLPLQVTTETICTSKEFVSTFSQHLKLIYTGKTRLARNLLQNVLRNWYTKRQDILDTCYQLKNNAEDCVTAFQDEDLARIGHHINLYWEQKKIMAPGCEPQFCTQIMKELSPFTFGQALTGAGGGGFMYAVTKDPLSSKFLTDLLKTVDGGQDVIVYDVQVDEIGMVCQSQSIIDDTY